MKYIILQLFAARLVWSATCEKVESIGNAVWYFDREPETGEIERVQERERDGNRKSAQETHRNAHAYTHTHTHTHTH